MMHPIPMSEKEGKVIPFRRPGHDYVVLPPDDFELFLAEQKNQIRISREVAAAMDQADQKHLSFTWLADTSSPVYGDRTNLEQLLRHAGGVLMDGLVQKDHRADGTRQAIRRTNIELNNGLYNTVVRGPIADEAARINISHFNYVQRAREVGQTIGLIAQGQYDQFAVLMQQICWQPIAGKIFEIQPRPTDQAAQGLLNWYILPKREKLLGTDSLKELERRLAEFGIRFDEQRKRYVGS